MTDWNAEVDRLIDERQGFEAMEPANFTHAVQIHEKIWMSAGTSNAYMLLTEAGRIIINTGMGFEALTHKRVFDQVCEGPTPYIV